MGGTRACAFPDIEKCAITALTAITVDLSCMGKLITPSRSSRETAPTQIQDIRHCDAWLATTVLPLHFQNEIAISAQALLRVGIHGRPPGFTFVGAQQETQLPRRFGRNPLGFRVSNRLTVEVADVLAVEARSTLVSIPIFDRPAPIAN